MSDSLRPHGLYSPRNSLGQNTGVGSLSLPNPGIKPRSPALQADSLPAEPQEKPFLLERTDKLWLFRFGSLAGVFSKMNQVSQSLQGKKLGVSVANDKK